MNKYKDLTQEKFEEILCDIVGRLSSQEIMSIPGIYECISEEFNNQALDEWEGEQKRINIIKLENKYNRFSNALYKLQDFRRADHIMFYDGYPEKIDNKIKYIENILDKLQDEIETMEDEK
jgi:hypothetical protein